MLIDFSGLEILDFNVPPLNGKHGTSQAIAATSSSFLLPRIAAGTKRTQALDTVAPPTAALAGAGAGNVNNGTHSYKLVKLTHSGHSIPSAKSNVVTTVGGNGKVNVTLPGWIEADVYAVQLYRTTAGDAGPWKLLTTSYVPGGEVYLDNVADGSLGADAPSTDTSVPTLRLVRPRRIAVTADIAFCYRTGVTAPTALVTDTPLPAGGIVFINVPPTHKYLATIARDGTSTGTLWYGYMSLQQALEPAV